MPSGHRGKEYELRFTGAMVRDVNLDIFSYMTSDMRRKVVEAGYLAATHKTSFESKLFPVRCNKRFLR